MSLYTRWVIATVGAAVAGYLLTLPIYRHAADLGLGDRFTQWQAAAGLIELVVYVLVTYWALAPVFPKLRAARYAALTILPTLILLVLLAMLDADIHGAAGSAAPPADAPGEDSIIAALIAAPFLLLATWGLFSLQWLSLSEAAEGYWPWVGWAIAGTVAAYGLALFVEQSLGSSPYADLSTAGRQASVYLYAVAISSLFGIVSGIGVARLRPKP
ncbi:MAG: hypothetical protein R3D57_19785 [Hyphomicrobiaceae bacterium]